MRFPFFRNRDSVKNGILISIRWTGDGFHPGLFNENGQFWNVVIPALIGAAVGTFLTWAATSATGQEYTTKDYLSDFSDEL